MNALRKLAACALCLPALFLVLGRGGGPWPLVLVALAAPRLLGGRNPANVWTWAVVLAFATPMWPVLARVLPFGFDRLAVHGALASLLWSGALRRTAPPSRWERLAEGALGVWLAWSLGSALRAVWTNVPADAPWLTQLFALAGTELVGFPSMVAETHPLFVLVLRAEAILLAWSGLRLAARADLANVLARRVPLALGLGLATAFLGLWSASRFRGEDFLVRLSEGVPRMHWPTGDHNALGSALVLLLPPAIWIAWRAIVRARREGRWSLAIGPAAAVACGLFLLVTSRSKSALLGAGFTLAVAIALSLARSGRRARRFLLASLAVLLLIEVGINVVPPAVLGEIRAARYVEDVWRALRIDGAVRYLQANRVAVWRGGMQMAADHPAFGVGLGNFPRELASYHDPTADEDFNPLHENAHSQYLQWHAEEGPLGLALASGVIGLALFGGVRALRRRREPSADLAWTAALAGLLVNLLVGHALLVSSVSILFGAVVGVLLGRGAVESSSSTALEIRGSRLPRMLATVAASIAALPVLWTERAPLPAHEVGCYPWQFYRGAVPPRARALAPDARWMQVWGSEPRMILPVKDVLPPLLAEERVLRIEVADRESVARFVLPRSDDLGRPNPVAYLKLDGPPGVRPDDLVPIRIVCEPAFAETLIFGEDPSRLGPRIGPPVFREPR